MIASLESGFLAGTGTGWRIAAMRPGDRPLAPGRLPLRRANPRRRDRISGGDLRTKRRGAFPGLPIFRLPATPRWRLAHAKRDAVYWLADEYSLFYLTWIEKHRGRADGVWMRKQGTPAWRAWTGLAFEATCLKHVSAIKRALGISGIETVDATWSHRANADAHGAQVDLVIDRADRSANLCEMKFSEAEFVIDKAYARELAHKRDTFRAITKTRKALFTTLVTTYGVRANEHAMNLGVQTVRMDALFS
jgi:hypothetical protein